MTAPAFHLDTIVDVLKTIAEPTRLRILKLLSETDLTVSELTGVLGQSQPRVSRHLKLMLDARLIKRQQEGSWALFRLSRDAAADVLVQELLTRIKSEALKMGLQNIDVIWGDIEEDKSSRILDASADVVIVSNVLFLIKKRGALLREIDRVLKRNGKMLVIDWKDSFGGLGPTNDDVVTEGEAKILFKKHNFILEREITAGAHHYGLVFKRNQ